MITAKKNGHIRHFSENQWANMPKSKFGWVIVTEIVENSSIVSADLIQKKMVAGQVVDAEKKVPDEITIIKKSVEPAKEKTPVEIKKRESNDVRASK